MKIVVKEKHQLSAPVLHRDPLLKRTYPRKKLADMLYQYNVSIGNDAQALAQIEKLKNSDSVCVITGQQLGLMGGPSYTILKALTCLQLAKDQNAIPIFWLATEDHDVAEIDQTFLLDSLGNLQKFSLGLSKDGKSVEDLTLTPKNWEVLSRFCEVTNLPTLPNDSDSYSHVMASFLARQFAGTGLVFLEPKILRPLAVPFFQREIEACDPILEILQGTTEQIGSRIIPFNEGSNLFMKTDHGKRCKIRKHGDWFSVDGRSFSAAELISLIKDQPERFSTNVAARPLLQSLLFPTLAYVAGPGEIAYHRQLVDYFRYYDVPMPTLVPRQSAALIPAFAQDFLGKCRLNPWEPLPHHWIELLPDAVQAGETLQEEWQKSIQKHFQEDLSEETLRRYVKSSIRRVMHKVCKVRIRKKGVPTHALHLLRNLLHPHDKPQDRVLNWWNFQSHTKQNLIQEFLKNTTWNTVGQLYCYLD